MPLVVGITATLATSLLLLWPTDRLVFSRLPQVADIFDVWRPRSVALLVLLALVLRLVPMLRRYSFEVGLVFCAIIEFFSGLDFGALSGSNPFFNISFVFQFGLVLVPVPIHKRIGGLILLGASFGAGYLLINREAPHDPYFLFSVLAGFLISLANTLFGHIAYHLLWMNFLANAKSERLLLNILPGVIAERLKESAQPIADRLESVTVLFADICGFTPLSESLSPEGLVHLLNQIFSEFDALAERHGLEKIKTIGDAYMAAAGLPSPRPDHAAAVARMALDMVAVMEGFQAPNGRKVQMRIGIHSGPVVAGVIGSKKFSYDLWGDTVNTASRMESHGVVGGVTLSESTHELLRAQFRCTDRGMIYVKGKGEMRLFQLDGPVA
jgi:class 3 adenylate cyclase